MDWAVGAVVEALEPVRRETVVFFTSDHGPHVELCLEGGLAGPLRGGKAYSGWEGGVRVPGIVSWPGTVRPGVSDALVSTMDVFATALDLDDKPDEATTHGKRAIALATTLLGEDHPTTRAYVESWGGD